MNRFNLDQETFTGIFEDKAKTTIAMLQKLEQICEKAGFKLRDFTDDFIWHLFQDIVYDVEEECRIIEKKTDPEKYQEVVESSSTMFFPSRQELLDGMNDIKKMIAELKVN